MSVHTCTHHPEGTASHSAWPLSAVDKLCCPGNQCHSTGCPPCGIPPAHT